MSHLGEEGDVLEKSRAPFGVALWQYILWHCYSNSKSVCVQSVEKSFTLLDLYSTCRHFAISYACADIRV